jgi:hypothetical protein
MSTSLYEYWNSSNRSSAPEQNPKTCSYSASLDIDMDSYFSVEESSDEASGLAQDRKSPLWPTRH